jgi:CRISPR system Cascade subunit CasD
MTAHAALVLRLAGPLQAWGRQSTFGRHDTSSAPTKSGVVGLLAAAAGRTRQDAIDDLCGLRLGVRVDQPGGLLRDYHTISDYRGVPLPTAALTAKRTQKPTSPAKYTHVTQRFYLQDAVFVAVLSGPRPLIETLDRAVRYPGFPLALGRRACVPTQPVTLGVWDGELAEALARVPWQAAEHAKTAYIRESGRRSTVPLSVTVEDDHGDDLLNDVPTSFDPTLRRFTTRRVRHDWISVPTGWDEPDDTAAGHDPFALLGW